MRKIRSSIPPSPRPDGEAAVAAPRRGGFSFGKIAAGAFGILLSLAFGLWTDQLIRDLFSRADWLGYTALAALGIGILAVLAIVIRETAGMMRLAAVQTIKAEAEAAIAEIAPCARKSTCPAPMHAFGDQSGNGKRPRHAESGRGRYH